MAGKPKTARKPKVALAVVSSLADKLAAIDNRSADSSSSRKPFCEDFGAAIQLRRDGHLYDPPPEGVVEVPEWWDLHDKISATSAAISKGLNIYDVGGNLAELREQDGTAKVEICSEAKLAELTSATVRFVYPGDEETPDEHKAVKASAATIKGVYARRVHPNARPLENIIVWPYERPDGTFCLEPGYDSVTKTITPKGSYEDIRINTRATVDEVRAAFRRLLFPIAEFEFENRDIAHGVFLSCVFTLITKSAYPGPAGPLHVFSGTSPGVGKSLLMKLIGWLVTGRDIQFHLMKNKDQDLNNLLLSLGKILASIIAFDNLTISTGTGGAALNQALTNDTITERMLHTNNVLTYLLRVLWMATINGVYRPAADGARRSILAHLTTQTAKPERRQFKQTDIVGWARANRTQFLTDACTLLVAYNNAGRPAAPRLGSFDGWSNHVRGPIVWLGQLATGDDTLPQVADPVLSQENLVDAGMIFVELIVKGFERHDKAMAGLTVGRMHELAASDKDSPFKDAVGDMKLNAFGSKLLEFDGRISGQFRLAQVRASSGRTWRLHRIG